jgi:hypothetical protein
VRLSSWHRLFSELARGTHTHMVRVMQCSVLRNACLKIQSPQPSCSRDCPQGNRSFRIDIYGGAAAADVQRALSAKEQGMLRDPLNSFLLRHIERDIWVNGSAKIPAGVFASNSSLHMFWPRWERGYGDFVMGTLIAFGYELARGRLPANLAISGVGYQHLLKPLLEARPSLCTFEREAHTVPRCREACYSKLHLCTMHAPTQANAWVGMAALDEQIGFSRPQRAIELPQPSDLAPLPTATTPVVLHVMFARRRGRRYITNIKDLLHLCEQRAMAVAPPLRVECSAYWLGDMPLQRVSDLILPHSACCVVPVVFCSPPFLSAHTLSTPPTSNAPYHLPCHHHTSSHSIPSHRTHPHSIHSTPPRQIRSTHPIPPR